MSKRLPYQATTSSGNRFEFDFELHPDTQSPVQVANLLSAVLEALDREIQLQGRVGNGDLLQALAMALAVRTRMLDGDHGRLEALAQDLLKAALASPVTPAAGNVAASDNRPLH